MEQKQSKREGTDIQLNTTPSSDSLHAQDNLATQPREDLKDSQLEPTQNHPNTEQLNTKQPNTKQHQQGQQLEKERRQQQQQSQTATAKRECDTSKRQDGG